MDFNFFIRRPMTAVSPVPPKMEADLAEQFENIDIPNRWVKKLNTGSGLEGMQIVFKPLNCQEAYFKGTIGG